MITTLTVACVLSEGPQRTYDRSHVQRLENMVAEHMEQPYHFICLDDSPFPGWWAKISLFEPRRFSGRVLYLDLDVTVIGLLDDLVNFDTPFIAIQDYQHPIRINSSVMVWDAGVADHIYTKFVPVASEVMDKMHGDQNWIHQCIAAERFPKRWCPSYKAHILPTGKVPDDARIIVFHGVPKPWDLEAA